jgi:HK97 family phage major capsid protein
MDPMEQKRSDLEALNAELKTFQEKYTGGVVPSQTEADAIDAKATEALALQKELDEHTAKSQKLQKALNWKPAEFVEPPDHQPDNVVKAHPEKIVGFMRVGEYVIAQGHLKEFCDAGKPKAGQYKLAEIPGHILPGRRERESFVGLTAKQINELYERKAVPTIGAGVIEPQRIPGIVKVTEFDRLVLRDILNIGQTNSNSVEWVREVSYTRAAEPTAPGAEKPESAKVFDLVSSPVRTIAVWMPVQDQQLDDWPALQGLINTNLLYDLDKRVEELVTWGDGIGQNFLGFFLDPLVWAMGQMNAAGLTRVVAGDTNIDIIRRGITDVRVAGYDPNGILVHPYDWEDIQLLKATDNNYIWVIVTEGGVSRLWGVPVIETVACEDFQGNAIEQRNMLVGDFTRGATLWDRMQSSVSVGLIDRQFVENMRTILAELRAAWAIRRPGAFRDFQTQAAQES